MADSINSVRLLHGRGLACIPSRDQDHAPKTFTDKSGKLEEFLLNLNKIFERHELKTDLEKVEALKSYLGGKARQIAKIHPAFQTKLLEGEKGDPPKASYKSAVQALRDAFPRLSENFKYSPKDLDDFVEVMSEHKIHTFKDVVRYQNDFQIIAYWLQRRKLIDEDRLNRAAWTGLHPSIRTFLKNNGHKWGVSVDQKMAPKATDVFAALRSYYSHDNWDAHLEIIEANKRNKKKALMARLSRDSDDSSSDSDDSSDSSNETVLGKALKNAKHTSDHSSLTDTDDTEPEPPRRRALDSSGQAQQQVRFAADSAIPEVEDLTRRLATLDIKSIEYQTAWGLLVEHYPRTALALSSRPTQPQHDVGALGARRSSPSGNQSGGPSVGDPRCFGCGGHGHRLRECPGLQEYIEEKILFINQQGYLRLTDGTSLPPFSGDAPLLPALRKRGYVPRSQAMDSVNATPYGAHMVESSDGILMASLNFIEFGNHHHSAPISVYGADRQPGPESQTRAHPYQRPPSPATRTRAASARAAAEPPAAPPPAAPAQSPAGLAAAPPPSQPTPAAAVPPQPTQGVTSAVVGDGDARMKDAASEKRRQSRRYTLTSELDGQFPVASAVKALIDQPVTIPAGVLLSQPNVQKVLLPMLQRHKTYESAHGTVLDDDDDPQVCDVDLLAPPPSRSPLTTCGVGRVQARVGDCMITALLDSGSEINVISRAMSDRLCLPLTRCTGMMRTADGRTTPMVHICLNVPIDIGGIRANSHLYVLEQSPYDLLLGRPWQRLVRYEHRDIAQGLLVTIHDPTGDRVHSFIAASPGSPEQSYTRSTYLGDSRVCDGLVRDVCRMELELAVALEHAQEEQAFLDGQRHKRTTVTKGDDAELSVFAAYKPVARKVRPVAATIEEEDRVLVNLPPDFEDDLPAIPFSPPPLQYGERLTLERLAMLDLDPDKLLQPEELGLLIWVLLSNELALAFDESEKGAVDPDIVPPVRIPVVEHEIWDQRRIPLPAAIKSTVTEILRQKIESKLYEPSSAAYTSRWFAVKKKAPGDYRIVHDLQPLNAVTKRIPGRLPPIDSFVGELCGRVCTGVADLFSGFDQVWLAIESRDRTTFETDLGRLRSTRLPQGGTNSCIVFHFIVVAVVGPSGRVYVDDTFIPGPTSTYGDEAIPENPKVRRWVFEYLQSLHRVLFRLRKVGMTVSARKLAAIRRTVEVLGQEVGPEGRRVAQGKVDAVVRWERCSSVTEVRSFLGLAGQARAWIPNYSAIVQPLTALTRKGTVFHWGPEEQAAMDTIKTAIAERTHLVELKYSEDMKPIILGVDAGPTACGFWLGQADQQDEVRIARFGSLPFNEREQGYSQAKRELFAVFRALKHSRHWLWGTRVIVQTDAAFIKGMLSNPELPNSAMVRWLAYILLFDLEVVHVKAKDNQLADGLSRRPAQPDDDSVTDDDEWLQDRLDDSQPNLAAAQVVSPPDVTHTTFGSLSSTLFSSSSSSSSSSLRSPPRPSSFSSSPSFAFTEPFFQVLSASETSGSPAQPTKPIYTADHQAIFDFLSTGKKPSSCSSYSANKAFLQRATRYFVTGDTLWRKGGVEGAGRLVVDSQAERERYMSLVHEESGHKGLATTAKVLGQRVFWRDQYADVRRWLETCDTCQRRERGVGEAQIRPTIAPGLFERIGLDITYLPKALGRRYLVVARCDLSGWVEASALKKKTARAVARFLFDRVLTRHGIPLQVTTDSGAEFKGVVDQLLKKYKVDLTRTSAFNPRANGAVERGHPPLKEAIVHASRTLDVPWPEAVSLACWIDRTAVRRQYGHSPYFLTYGHEPRLPIDLASPALVERFASIPDDVDALQAAIAHRITALGSHKLVIELARSSKNLDRSKSAARRNLQELLRKPIFEPGQHVLVRNFDGINSKKAENKVQDNWLGPYKVIWQSIHGGVWLISLQGIPLPSSIHPSHVKEYRPRILTRLAPPPTS